MAVRTIYPVFTLYISSRYLLREAINVFKIVLLFYNCTKAYVWQQWLNIYMSGYFTLS